MKTMTTKQAKKIVRDNAANVYAQIYGDRFKKIAAQAFMDGMVFAKMVASRAVTDDMINEDLFKKLHCTLFPEVTFENSPMEVELVIKK